MPFCRARERDMRSQTRIMKVPIKISIPKKKKKKPVKIIINKAYLVPNDIIFSANNG